MAPTKPCQTIKSNMVQKASETSTSPHSLLFSFVAHNMTFNWHCNKDLNISPWSSISNNQCVLSQSHTYCNISRIPLQYHKGSPWCPAPGSRPRPRPWGLWGCSWPVGPGYSPLLRLLRLLHPWEDPLDFPIPDKHDSMKLKHTKGPRIKLTLLCYKR